MQQIRLTFSAQCYAKLKIASIQSKSAEL